MRGEEGSDVSEDELIRVAEAICKRVFTRSHGEVASPGAGLVLKNI